jgi:hypothetical protein
MSKYSLKSRFALLVGAVAVVMLSLSFTSSSTSKQVSAKATSSNEGGNVGGFVQDPK